MGKDCRAIVEASIEQHNGRVFGGAGDSLIAEFSSPLQAVVCANDFQQSIAERNQERPEDDRMWFRVGINLGDVMVDGDNLYGDGVNIAARLEQIGEPGGVCVSHKVFEEVRRNLGLPFVDGGIRELKNISEPVAVHHVRPVTDDRSGKTGTEAGQSRAPPNRAVPPRPVPSAPEQHSIIVHPFKVTGDDETEFLAEGLRDGLSGILSKSSAVKLVADAEHGRMRPDFILEGNVRGRGDRIRLSFGLIDTATNSQVWSERYDRSGSDAFELEDEISQAVASVLRVKLKALAFEQLRNTGNEELSVPDLLNKAAGYFVTSPGNNDEIEQILRLAIEKSPDNAMALAMMAVCLYRPHEFSPLALPQAARQEIMKSTARAIALDPDGYFTRFVVAMMTQDLEGDFERALIHGQTALQANPDFTQAMALVAIAKIHLGQIEEGLNGLRRAIAANKDDPQRFRHHRELAVALFMAGELEEAASISTKLVEQAPEMDRNKLVHAALLWHADQQEKAVAVAAWLKEKYPALTGGTMRPVQFGASDAAVRFNQAFRDMGFEPADNVVSIGKR